MGRSPLRLTAFALLALVSGTAHAGDRIYVLTSFDKVRISGPYTVIVETGRGVSARASGVPEAIDRVTVDVQGQTLVIRPNRFAWGSAPSSKTGPVILRFGTRELSSVYFSGSGKLDVNKMRASRLVVFTDGSGTANIGQIEGESAAITASGNGSLKLSGRVANADTVVQGNAILDAPKLSITDLKLITQGAAITNILAVRSAKITATGSGTTAVLGKSTCTVNNVGTGEVQCGEKRAANRF
jgi:Putative auto-transporter adhesin, head GIN domain